MSLCRRIFTTSPSFSLSLSKIKQNRNNFSLSGSPIFPVCIKNLAQLATLRLPVLVRYQQWLGQTLGPTQCFQACVCVLLWFYHFFKFHFFFWGEPTTPRTTKNKKWEKFYNLIYLLEKFFFDSHNDVCGCVGLHINRFFSGCVSWQSANKGSVKILRQRKVSTHNMCAFEKFPLPFLSWNINLSIFFSIMWVEWNTKFQKNFHVNRFISL